ncbi:MAG: hypothetical protein ACU83P_09725 [Gammaproteobacteria bacterium]
MKLIKNVTILAAAIGLCLTSASAMSETAGYLSISRTEVKVKGKGDAKTLAMEVQAAEPIPVDGKSGAFGYAALSDDANNLLVLVTHLPIDDSSYENQESGFHAHVLDLKAPTEACKGANFEVDLENSGKNAAFDADYKWAVDNNRISVQNVPVKDLGNAGVETIVSFTLKPVLDANKKPTNLCITVADKA